VRATTVAPAFLFCPASPAATLRREAFYREPIALPLHAVFKAVLLIFERTAQGYGIVPCRNPGNGSRNNNEVELAPVV
jgi:hypothetical protein